MGWLGNSKTLEPAQTVTSHEDNFSNLEPLEASTVTPTSKPIHHGRADAQSNTLLASLESSDNADDPSQAQFDPSAPASAPRNAITPSTLYPAEISCHAAFDAAFYCQSLGGQLNNVYRYGSFRSCSQHWSDFWFCMRTNRSFLGEEERERRVQKHYRLRELKYKVGHSSEDVWKGRTRMVDGAFEGYFEGDQRTAEERKMETRGDARGDGG
ncbi:MAG: hypothetical protein Q9202_004092 [Teloschistes flavicans]